MSSPPLGAFPSPPALEAGPAAVAAARRRALRAPRPYWLCQIGGWAGYWLVNAWAAVTYGGIAWGRAAVDDALLALLGIGAALLVLRLRNVQPRQ